MGPTGFGRSQRGRGEVQMSGRHTDLRRCVGSIISAIYIFALSGRGRSVKVMR